jgi:hypothetical protein
VAAIFDNLHMLHDNISDILASDRLPTWEVKRTEIYRILDSYYLATADATNPMIVREGRESHPKSHAEPSAPSPAGTEPAASGPGQPEPGHQHH